MQKISENDAVGAPSGRWRQPSRRASGLAVAAVALAVGAGVVATGLLGGGAEDELKAFLSRWEQGDDRAAAARTDDPTAARRALGASRRGLDGADVAADVVSVDENDGRARARVRLEWDVPGIGGWGYETSLGLVEVDGEWKVRWAPSLIHPRLEPATRLGTVRSFSERAPILDRRGSPLVSGRPVVRVGAVAGDVKDARATADGLAEVLDVDPKPVARAIRRGGPEQFVEAITLRVRDYRRVESRLAAIPDVTTIEAEAQLAPTRAFARALLGTVAPATAEQLKRLDSPYAVGDSVGQWGLQARFERRLAGTPTGRVVIRARGVPIETLHRRPGRRGKPLRTTLDERVQGAAEKALGGRSQEAAVIALQPSSGDILAVANRPVDSSYDRALEGGYAPGSTFKVITTAALLRAGLKTGERVGCPRTVAVEGKLFRNFEGVARGLVPFSVDFAQSCNTAFVSLAQRLPRRALAETARDFGFGRPLKLPLRAARAEVPPAEGAIERAASMIGQHRIIASPLAMAGVAATVANGRWRAPRLLASDSRRAGSPLAEEEAVTLRRLMRSVVTDGTAAALVGVPGEVAAKTGTAEFGGGNRPPTHAWLIGYRGDLALAVLVERGRSGGSVAAPIAARFFRALDNSAP
jgi:cell division protein FtsI/penicillin-binding protein 2